MGDGYGSGANPPRLANPAAGNQSAHLQAPVASLLLQCNETRYGSVAVRAHLVRDLALLQAVLREPSVGAQNGAIDVIGGTRKIVRRSDPGAQWGDDEIFDPGTEVFEVVDQFPRDQRRLPGEGVGDLAGQRCAGRRARARLAR